MKASDHAGVLPVLAESPRRQVVLSGLWVVLFVLLLTAAAVRIGAEVQPTWWLPVALFLGIAAADFGSGLVHWAADTWGRADLPCIGPRVLLPFRLHHVNPDDFLRRSFLDTNGDAAAGMVPILALLLWMPLDTTQWQAAGPFLFALCAFGGLTNQIHQWHTCRRRRRLSAYASSVTCSCHRSLTPRTTRASTMRITASPRGCATGRSRVSGSSGALRKSFRG
jgi:hypothetical protein